jgi:hypothetical protein
MRSWPAVWRSALSSAIVAAAVACGHRGVRGAAGAGVGTEVTDLTGCYDDSNGPCVVVTVRFSNPTSQAVTVEGYRVAWPDVTVSPGAPGVGKSAPDVHFRLDPGAVESRTLRVGYGGVDRALLKKENARVDILDWR